jgi:hypothetical protein
MTRIRMAGVCGVVLGVFGLGACASSDEPGGPDPGGDHADAAPGSPDAQGEPPASDILPENMIDDLDDGDPVLLRSGGRSGAWYTYNDMTATGQQTPAMGSPFMPSPGGANGSAYAATTQGSGFTVWGAGMGFDLDVQMSVKHAYDASAFHGVEFTAKGSGPVRAAIMIESVVSSEVGGACTPSTVAGEKCDDGHGTNLFLTGNWTVYKLPFAEIRQAGWGKPVAFDATKIMSIQFNVDKNLPFDFAIDSIGFY